MRRSRADIGTTPKPVLSGATAAATTIPVKQKNPAVSRVFLTSG
jgi:hypothetical protein